MRTLKRCFSLLMSAALITGISCTGVLAETAPGTSGESEWGTIISDDASQGTIREENGSVYLDLYYGSTVTFTSAHLGGTVSFPDPWSGEQMVLRTIIAEPGCIAYSTSASGEVYTDEDNTPDAMEEYENFGRLLCHYYGVQPDGTIVIEGMNDGYLLGNTYVRYGLDAYMWDYSVFIDYFYADDGPYWITTQEALDLFTELTGIPVAGTPEEKPATVAGFSDVPADAWYAGYVETVAEKGLFSGNEDGTFAPEANMTYAQFLVVLSQFSGDAISGAEGAWYQGYVNWANEAGLIPAGMQQGFNPDAAITRQDMAALFGSFLNTYDHSGETVNSGEASFADAGSIADYAADGVQTCYELGIMSGKDGGVFDPMGTATRAEVAVTMVQMAHIMER